MPLDAQEERSRVQCLAWAGGHSYHEPLDSKCCPDFSCCYPDLFTADAATRWAVYRRTWSVSDSFRRARERLGCQKVVLL